jgi:isoquinoline 1-oxidoreductase beta subunit
VDREEGPCRRSAVWDEGANATVGQAQVIAAIEPAVQAPGVTAKAEGDLAAARAAPPRGRSAYHQPFLAHATMEPGNCTAHVTPQGAQVWAGSKCRPTPARRRPACWGWRLKKCGCTTS